MTDARCDDRRLYSVRWSRPDHPSVMECSGLTPRVFFARLMNVVRNSGSATIHSIQPDAPRIAADGIIEAWATVKQWIDSYEDEEATFSRYADGVILDGLMSAGQRRAIAAALGGPRPMGTAPKDGTEILLVCVTKVGAGRVVSIHNAHWVEQQSNHPLAGGGWRLGDMAAEVHTYDACALAWLPVDALGGLPEGSDPMERILPRSTSIAAGDEPPWGGG